MGLRLTLKPWELLIINGAMVRNGDRSVALHIENQCKFLRESEILRDDDADTDCKKLCVTLQTLYLATDPTVAVALFHDQSRNIMAKDVAYSPYLLKISLEMSSGEYYKAIKIAREMIAYEADRNGLEQPSSHVA